MAANTRILSTLCVLLFAAGADAAPLRVCLVSGSFEYDSDASLTAYAAWLETHYEVECTLLKATGWAEIPGLEALEKCDAALFFTRRLRLEGESLERIKAYCRAGKPVVAVRTASHGFQNWLEFDKEVLGGNYQGHYDEGLTLEAHVPALMKTHPILGGVGPIRSRYSLYKSRPLAEDAELLMSGSTPMADGDEPLAWTRVQHGGRVFYTSLGGAGDFEGASFKRLLANALYWAAQRGPAPKPWPDIPARRFITSCVKKASTTSSSWGYTRICACWAVPSASGR